PRCVLSTSRVPVAFKSRIQSLFEIQTGRSRLRPMEGMRGLSALLVFFVHYYALFGSRALPPALNHAFLFLATLGHCGVDVFFALSGFIIYGILIEKPVRYFAFVGRRIVRLYPVFSAVFIMYLVLDLAFSVKPLPASFFPAMTYLLANFLMLPGMFPIVPLI